MPLAALRKQVRDLPLSFTLDDSMAMTPGMSLSAFPRVVVGARISKSATAAAQPGDLQGLSAPVPSDANGVAIVIDTVVH
jgi:cytochrome c-type biogenesis protein CcmH